MAAAGAEAQAQACPRVGGRRLQCRERIIARDRSLRDWDHYPDGDVYDRESHARYYFHAHPKTKRPGEYGHFHTFLRQQGMPAGMRPAENAGDAGLDDGDTLSHIVAISVDESGNVIGLFTTNRWVTGEIWYTAGDVVALMDCFRVEQGRTRWMNRWITAVLRLFRPQIVDPLHRRDRAIANWRKLHPESDAFEDRALEVPSQIAISIPEQIRDIRAALEKMAWRE